MSGPPGTVGLQLVTQAPNRVNFAWRLNEPFAPESRGMSLPCRSLLSVIRGLLVIAAVMSVCAESGCPAPRPRPCLGLIADAGPDLNVVGGTTLSLNGDRSSMTGSAYATYDWVQIDGTPVIALEDPHAVNTMLTLPQGPAAYEFELTVRDNEQDCAAADTVRITVDQYPECTYPVADAGEDLDVEEGTYVTLSGAELNGLPAEFTWRQIAGPRVSLSEGTRHRSFAAHMRPQGEPTLRVFELGTTFECTLADGTTVRLHDTDQVRVHVR